MRRYIVLLLITGIVWAQTDFDKLVLEDKTVYTGTLIKFDDDEIIFRALPSAKMSINISDIQELKLSDGTKVFENGIKVATNEKYIENTSYDRYLSVFNEKYKNNAKERVFFCCLIIILFGFLVVKDIGSNFGSGFPDGPWPGDGHP